MKIGIDARFYNESGVGRYLRNLIKNLQILDGKNEYFIFLLPKDFENFKEIKNFHKISADFKWYGFAEQFNFPKLLNKYQLDLVHFPHFNVPIFYAGKFVITIHDLIHQHYSMKRSTKLDPLTFKIKQIGYKKIFKTGITKSENIFVPSETVKNLLISEWDVDKNKIVVTPEAIDDDLLFLEKKVNTSKINIVLEKFGIRASFIFYVGNAHPHKNVEGLIKAFVLLKQHYKDIKLVLSGHDHYFWERMKKENTILDVIYTGYINDRELVALYKSAEVFVLPSFEEGFGLPILEAMACSCPVVSSNAGSLKEVGGNAALYFNPNNTNDMVNKIRYVLNNASYKKSLIDKGKKRVKLFSWKKMAEQTLEAYKACV